MKDIGAADAVTKAYIRKNEVFADAFNYFMYDGEQKIQPEQLREMDTTEIAILLNEKDTKDNKNKDKKASKQKIVQKYRDQLKMTTIMEDDKAAYVLLGIESQTEVHTAMVVRNMLYDALQYSAQLDIIAARHREQRDYSASEISTAEFLSGFHKDDKLIPVITLVLFFNAGEWEGPRSLHEMMNIPDENIKKLVVDYPLYLIDPGSISDKDLEKFHSSLREVMGCIKYSNDKNKLADFIYDNPRMNMEIEAARVIETITSVTIENEEVDRMGNVNMCKAIQEMMQDSRDEGRMEASFSILSKLIQSGDISLQKAASLMNMTTEEFLVKSKTIS